MILGKLYILNYKNIEQADLTFSPNVNCFIGQNGMGKTNVLDAIFFLSFCKSANNPIDSQVIRHDQEFSVIQGFYRTDDDVAEEIYCGLKRRQKKHFRRNKKEYSRLADHIGLIPLVMVTPSDADLINGGSEERRRFMDLVISQYDRPYLDSLIKYNKALMQRNALLKMDSPVDDELMSVWEEMMAVNGEFIYQKRLAFIEEFIPTFQSYYSYISQDREPVALSYQSHASEGNLLDILKQHREKDRIMGFSLKGIHRDDLIMKLGDYPIKKEASQGQNKTFLIALKLSQFDFLKRTGSRTTPLLLLDDIFDKLDASRVEKIVELVSGDSFGQIFITDTNRDHLDKILKRTRKNYKIFHVEEGNITEVSANGKSIKKEESDEKK